MVLDHQADHPSQRAAIQSIAMKIGGTAETLCKWVPRKERASGAPSNPIASRTRGGLTNDKPNSIDTRHSDFGQLRHQCGDRDRTGVGRDREGFIAGKCK
jgi:hypothetical protein